MVTRRRRASCSRLHGITHRDSRAYPHRAEETLALLWRRPRVRVQPVLRPPRRMAPRDHSDHAASRVRSCSWNSPAIPCRCKLCHRVRARRQDLGGGAGRIELHLRPLQRGLDRRPCRCAQLAGCGPEGAGGGATAPMTESAPVLRLNNSQCPRSTIWGPPISGGLMERGCIRGPALPQRAGPGLNPDPPCEVGTISSADHGFFCVGFGTALSANARVVSAMLQHRMGCLVAVRCRHFAP